MKFEKFNLIRKRFVYINKKMILIDNDSRDTEEILRKDYKISYYEFSRCIRGYFLENKLYIYYGYTYMPVPITELPDSFFEILKSFIERNTDEMVEIYNGLIIGEHCSFWEPVYKLAVYQNHDISLVSFSDKSTN